MTAEIKEIHAHINCHVWQVFEYGRFTCKYRYCDCGVLELSRMHDPWRSSGYMNKLNRIDDAIQYVELCNYAHRMGIYIKL